MSYLKAECYSNDVRAFVAVLVQVRVGVCEWLAWLLRMRREPEVDLVTTSHRRSSLIRRQSMRNDDIASRYSIRAGGHHLANEIGTNGNSSGSRDDWLASRRSTSLCRRGSIRSAQRRNTSRVELENDSSQWRSIQTIPAGGELEQDERSRSNTLLSNILDEHPDNSGRRRTGAGRKIAVKHTALQHPRRAAGVDREG